jgi:hypothetical protein
MVGRQPDALCSRELWETLGFVAISPDSGGNKRPDVTVGGGQLYDL